MNMRMLSIVFLCISNSAPAQVEAPEVTKGPGIIIDAGYVWKWHEPFNFARGQIVSIFVHGIGRDVEKGIVPENPFDFEGISVAVAWSPTGPQWPAAILRVQSVNDQFGDRFNSVGRVLCLTIQIPWELPVNHGLYLREASLVVYEKGKPTAEIIFSPYQRNVHLVWTGGDSIAYIVPYDYRWWRNPWVLHADGEPVSRQKPAEPGEELRMYGVGLGIEDSQRNKVKTGIPQEEDVIVPIGIEFQYGVDKKAERPEWARVGRPDQIPEGNRTTARLMKGQTGIYEIKFKVPTDLPDDLAKCTSLGNMTVVIAYPTQIAEKSPPFDGLPVCVAR